MSRRVACAGCGAMVIVWFTECGDHFHLYTVCICPHSGYTDGIIVDATKLDERGYPIGRHS